MIDLLQQELETVCRAFCIKGVLISYDEIKQGNINRTYRVDFLQDNGIKKSYLVQKVNTYVFTNPIQVMENIDKVTGYLRAKEPQRTMLHFHHTQDRKPYVLDTNGFWRLCNYIESRTFNHCEDLDIIQSAGQAFGKFQMLLESFDASDLHATIPHFHDTRHRYQTLLDDAAANPDGPAREVRDELNWLVSAEKEACALVDSYRRGEIPLRVTHNDTKINNVLFEKDGVNSIVVIDLDTVMPGLVGNDFGDAIRFAANRVEEDSRDWVHAGIDMDIFRKFADGFLKYTASTLTDREIDMLAPSCFSMACELATRFLDDYIMGNPYFKTNYPTHNLVRTRCQITLAKDMALHMDEMQDIIHTCAHRYRCRQS